MQRSHRLLAAAALVGAAACGADGAGSTTAQQGPAASADVVPSAPNASTTSPPTSSTSTTSTSTTSTSTSSTSTTSTSTTSTSTASVVPADQAAPERIVAATADGDAVLLTADGAGGYEVVLLWDGPSPAEVNASEEGPGPNTVDHMSVAPDGSAAWVGTCCEPISGAYFRTEPPEPIEYFGDSLAGGGYNPSASPDGRLLAVGSTFGFPLALTDLSSDVPVAWDGAEDLPPGVDFFTPYDTAWFDDRIAVVLGITDTSDGVGWSFTSASIDLEGGVVEPGAVVPLVDPGGFADVGDLNFGGVVRGELIVHESGDWVSRTFRLDGTESGGLVLDGAARSVWFEAGQAPVVVDVDGVLTVGGAVVPGEYVWARG